MKKTNFDSCSYMPSISLSVYGDCDMAQKNFKENFENISNTLYFYTDYNQKSWRDLGVEDLLDLSRVSSDEARDYLKDFDEYYDEEDGGYSDENLSLRLSDYLESESKTKDVLDKDSGFQFPKSATYKFKRIILRGYFQGDYAEVIIMRGDFNQSWWTGGDDAGKYSNLKTHFQHLFYDQEIYARLEIDEHEFLLHEDLKDTYDYDKEELIKIALDRCKPFYSEEKFAQIKEWMEENMPESL